MAEFCITLLSFVAVTCSLQATVTDYVGDPNEAGRTGFNPTENSTRSDVPKGISARKTFPSVFNRTRILHSGVVSLSNESVGNTRIEEQTMLWRANGTGELATALLGNPSNALNLAAAVDTFPWNTSVVGSAVEFATVISGDASSDANRASDTKEILGIDRWHAFVGNLESDVSNFPGDFAQFQFRNDSERTDNVTEAGNVSHTATNAINLINVKKVIHIGLKVLGSILPEEVDVGNNTSNSTANTIVSPTGKDEVDLAQFQFRNDSERTDNVTEAGNAVDLINIKKVIHIGLKVVGSILPQEVDVGNQTSNSTATTIVSPNEVDLAQFQFRNDSERTDNVTEAGNAVDLINIKKVIHIGLKVLGSILPEEVDVGNQTSNSTVNTIVSPNGKDEVDLAQFQFRNDSERTDNVTEAGNAVDLINIKKVIHIGLKVVGSILPEEVDVGNNTSNTTRQADNLIVDDSSNGTHVVLELFVDHDTTNSTLFVDERHSDSTVFASNSTNLGASVYNLAGVSISDGTIVEVAKVLNSREHHPHPFHPPAIHLPPLHTPRQPVSFPHVRPCALTDSALCNSSPISHTGGEKRVDSAQDDGRLNVGASSSVVRSKDGRAFQEPGMDVPVFSGIPTNDVYDEVSANRISGVYSEPRDQGVIEAGPVFASSRHNKGQLASTCPPAMKTVEGCPAWLVKKNPRCDSDQSCSERQLGAICCVYHCQWRCVAFKGQSSFDHSATIRWDVV